MLLHQTNGLINPLLTLYTNCAFPEDYIIERELSFDERRRRDAKVLFVFFLLRPQT